MVVVVGDCIKISFFVLNFVLCNFLYGVMCIWFKFTLIGYTNKYETLGLSVHVVDNKTRQLCTV